MSMVKLTKAQPTEAGLYYWSEGLIQEVAIVEVDFFRGDLVVDRIESGYFTVSRLGGYWAKVDQSIFQIED